MYQRICTSELRGEAILTLSRDQNSFVYGYRPHLLIDFDEMLYGSLYQHTLTAKSVGGGSGGLRRRWRTGRRFRIFYAFQTIWSRFAKFFFSLKILTTGTYVMTSYIVNFFLVPEVKIFSENFFCKSTPNGLKRVKNTKPPTRPPPPTTDFPGRVC